MGKGTRTVAAVGGALLFLGGVAAGVAVWRSSQPGAAAYRVWLQGVPAAESADWNTGDTDCPSSGRGVGPIGADDRAVPALSPGGPGQQVGAGQFLAYHVRVDADPLAPTTSDLTADLAFSGIERRRRRRPEQRHPVRLRRRGRPAQHVARRHRGLRQLDPGRRREAAGGHGRRQGRRGRHVGGRGDLAEGRRHPAPVDVGLPGLRQPRRGGAGHPGARHGLDRSARDLLPAEPRHRARAGRAGRHRPGAGSGRAAHDARAQHRGGRRRPRRRRPLQGRPDAW